MAFFSSNLKFKTNAPSERAFWQNLSLRGLRGILVGVLFCNVLSLLMLWQPAYFRLSSLQKDKMYWEEVLERGVTYTTLITPTMDQLPDMIEQSRSVFLNQGVDVLSLNVERFGERKGTEKGASIDYALVRLRLHGQRKGVLTSLKALEEMPGVSIHAQEVVLAEAGGEALLQIYFCTGEQVGRVNIDELGK